MTNAPEAGWHPDPSSPDRMRWWDGRAWTDQVRPLDAPASLLPPPAAVAVTAPRRRRRLPVWAWILIGVALVVLSVLLAPVLAVLFLVVLITGIVALAKGTPTWLRFRNRKVASVATAIALVGFLTTGSLAAAMSPDDETPRPLAVAPSPSQTTQSAPEPTRTSTPAATPTPTDDTDEIGPIAFSGSASAPKDRSATEGLSVREVLATLAVKGRAPKTGYDRDVFGPRWADIDRNGCDTRNDILAAQLDAVTREGSCIVLSGVLADPYTRTVIDFQRGQGTSSMVQIDHVVALSDAWQKGAQQLTADQRVTFANDPLNLLAVDGGANAQKRDGDAATWLPKNREFRCEYVSRQIAVKASYGLWVTAAEHDAMVRVLDACDDGPAASSSFAAPVATPTPTPAPTNDPVPFVPPRSDSSTPSKPAAPKPSKPAAPKPSKPAAPKPSKPAPPSDVVYKNCDDVRAHGAAPIHRGDPGYSKKLDRDGDGIGCE